MAKPHIIIPELTSEEAQHFWSKIRIEAPDQCWEWKENLTTAGYGQIGFKRFPRKNFHCHRMAYLLHYGKQPGELLVCHQCDNRKCCNPAHLFLGTSKDNNGDAAKKGRTCRGPRHRFNLYPETRTIGIHNPAAKLTEEQVREIRAKYALGNTSKRKLAKEYGIGTSNIVRIIKRANWKHI